MKLSVPGEHGASLWWMEEEHWAKQGTTKHDDHVDLLSHSAIISHIACLPFRNTAAPIGIGTPNTVNYTAPHISTLIVSNPASESRLIVLQPTFWHWEVWCRPPLNSTEKHQYCLRKGVKVRYDANTYISHRLSCSPPIFERLMSYILQMINFYDCRIRRSNFACPRRTVWSF